VNDAGLRAEVAHAISVNGWARNTNAQFVVLTAPGSTYASGFGAGFCAYHGVDSAGSSYTFDPYVGDAPFNANCAGYDPHNNVDNVTSMLASHEYAESATDPAVNAWLTSDGYEVGDICASGDDLLPDGAHAQGLWDNFQNACSLADTTRFPLPPAQSANSSWVVRDANTSYQWLYYRGTDGAVWEAQSTNGQTWVRSRLGGAVAEGSTPTVVRDPVTGRRWVFYNGTNAIYNWEWNGEKWVNGGLAGAAPAAGTSPSAVRDQGTGKQWVFYNGTNAIYNWEWNGEKWVNGGLAGAAPKAKASPTVVRSAVSGEQWVYYVATAAEIYSWVWTGTKWVNGPLGGSAGSGSSPTVVRDPVGRQWVFYNGTNAIYNWEWNGEKWVNGGLAGTAPAPGGAPAAAEDPGTGRIWVEYFAGSSAIWQWRWNGSSWANAEI
jgi:hypothetical protein